VRLPGRTAAPWKKPQARNPRPARNKAGRTALRGIRFRSGSVDEGSWRSPTSPPPGSVEGEMKITSWDLRTAMATPRCLRGRPARSAWSDLGVYPPMSTVLARAGIVVYVGYDPHDWRACTRFGSDRNAMSAGIRSRMLLTRARCPTLRCRRCTNRFAHRRNLSCRHAREDDDTACAFL